jgi:hypothetical protein
MADEYSWRWVAVVKVGFIVEGETESFLLFSENFKTLLSDLHIDSVGVINAGGNGNLLPHKILTHQSNLIELGASIIIILTDLDYDKCITKTKERISEKENQIIIVAVKQIEAWYLADSLLLTEMFGQNFQFEFPEIELSPFDTLRKLMLKYRGRGLPKKVPIALKMLANGFSIQNAANHPNCPSAKYFLTKLQSIVNN